MSNALGIFGLILGLAVLSVLIYKRVPAVLAALAATAVVALFNLLEPWTALTTLFNGIGSTFGTYFPVFFFATVYGKLMSDTGCANAIADYFIKLFGEGSVILVISVTTALLVYGGVTAMVVAFTVFPLGVSLCRRANISKKLLPAIIQLGQATFALTALPGTPQLNNIIPTSYLGTTSTAAPVLGLIATAIMFGLGYFYLKHEVRKSQERGEGFDEASLRPGSVSELSGEELPKPFLAFLPILLLIVLYMLFERLTIGGYSLKQFNSFAPVCTAMIVAILYLLILGTASGRKDTVIASVKRSSGEWIGPLLSFSIVVGFGRVIASTDGYAALVNAVTSMQMSPYLSAALSVTLLAGVTGSASGGINIALSSEQLVASWTSKLSTPAQLSALHRIISVSSCGLDSLPHCGGILATLDVCQESHATSYKYIFVITVIFTLVAAAVLVALASLGFTM
ncbi:MAG: GntP family permease [Erysipelotrichaceae bacterium]|nr:GntP family permease [Erysipelotrichaceae bacterium]MBR2551608.1 GntP family permease [Erysipelotrichaceae bacterium]